MLYAAIDMKSFYASVECVERKLNPLTTNLVVADKTRTDKTICLAVSPSLKSLGIPGRPRLYEVVQKVNHINSDRRKNFYGKILAGSSFDINDINMYPELKVDYIIAPPQMRLYEKYSAKIYSIYLKYFSKEDIHAYSCDEVFINIEPYITLYNISARTLVMKVIRDILSVTGITATAGIGTNMFLCKVAMDIVAKKIKADKDGVRIAELDESSYRKILWEHEPLVDFWGIGKGTARNLEKLGIKNMGELAVYSEYDSEKLYKIFGIKAEIIIDHAWGYESCTIKDIHNYKPKSQSLSNSQVLSRGYSNAEAYLILKEMVEGIVLKMVSVGYITSNISLSISYDSKRVPNDYDGKWVMDRYGRKMPEGVSADRKIEYTSSSFEIKGKFLDLFREITDKNLEIRRIGIALNNLIPESKKPEKIIQYDFFTDFDKVERENIEQENKYKKEKSIQNAMIKIKEKYGKNAIIHAISLQNGATAIERNNQIGGHRA